MVRNFLLYLLTIILFGVFAVLYNSYSTGLLFIIWTCIPIGTFLALLYNSFKLEVKLSVSSKLVFKGNQYEFIIQVENHAFLPIPRMDLTIEYSNQYDGRSNKQKIQVAVDSNSNQIIKTDIVSNYIGVVNIRISRIKIYDLLQLLSISKKKRIEVSTVILPSVYHQELRQWENYHGIDSEGEVIEKKGDDPSEVFNIREFQDGDRESRIHYKLSSKYGQTLIKEYSANQSNNRIIILDTINFTIDDKLYGMDVMLSILLSEIMNIHREGERCTIFYITKDNEIREVLLTTEDEVYLELEYFIMSLVKKNDNRKEDEYVFKNSDMLDVFHQHTNGKIYSHITYITSSMTKELILWAQNQYKKEFVHFIYINDFAKLPFEMALESEQLWNQDGLSDRQMFTPVDIHKGISSNNVK